MTIVRLTADDLARGGDISTARYLALADMFVPPTTRFITDPIAWANERAAVELWSKQKEILQSVADNPKTAVASCHSIGKSYIAGLAVAWWIDIHAPGEAFVFTTAPTGAQVKAVLWREINRQHARMIERAAGNKDITPFPGRTNLTEWYIGNELVAFGRKPDEKNPTGAQGTHALHFLIILDEACGVPKALWDASSTLAANRFGRTLAIGNPDDATTEFFNVCNDPGWNTIHIGYRDTPNFTGEHVSQHLKDMLISRAWVADRANVWGTTSALFMSKCEGQFPIGASPYVVVPLLMAQNCQHLDLPLGGSPREAGIDVGGGGDRTYIWAREGMKATESAFFVDADPMRTVGNLALRLREWRIEKVKVDSTGLGWGIAGRLKELSSRHKPSGERAHDAEVIAVNFAESPTPGKEKRLLNRRAELWWDVGRENSRLQRWDLGAVDPGTLQELTTPLYETLDSSGKVKIEAKEDVIKRLGRSPDSAEALLLAFLETTTHGSTTPVNMAEVDLTHGVRPGNWAETPIAWSGRRGF